MGNDEANDVCMETWERAFRSLSSLSHIKFFESWIFSIARNNALNRIKRDQTRKWLSLGSPALESSSTTTPTSNVTSGDLLVNAEAFGILRQEVARLVPQRRLFIELRYFENWPLLRIAEKEGTTVVSVHRQIAFALDELKKALSKRGYTNSDISVLFPRDEPLL